MKSVKLLLGYLLASMGTATIAAVVYFETEPDWVAVGYAALVVALLALAWRTGHEIFLYQSLVMLVFAAFRISMHNLYNIRDPLSSNLNAAIWAIALLACAAPLGFLVRGKREFTRLPQWTSPFTRHPEQFMFFVPVILLAVLLYLKISGGKVTLAWGAEGFVVFALALVAKERSFRLTGLALLLVCAGKLVYDTWYFHDPLVRAATWVGIGLLLLGVSFLFAKNRDAFRNYL
ncbi:MAG TPA: hypothetical protein VN176_08025 [Verrucomicrobiae bacterium]|jgi:hypothetical protein|nr:hypothetical protein [Verrucomicrobiae bacterium]